MYQALYRKWRPQTFDDVIGQKHITDSLKNQVTSGRLSHAYIFIGTRGTGKTTCARILAKAVNCEHPVNGNPCGQCASCRGIAEGTVMDVVELDAASNNGVDSVRTLRDEAAFSPADVKKRVYIIDEVHMLSTSAFNALLKIIEEPPEHLMFILATTELQKVPATILSRCQRHSFRRIDRDVLSSYLSHVASEEKIALSEDAADLIAGLAEGGVRDALSMLDQCSAYGTIGTEQVYTAVGLAGNRRLLELFVYVRAHDTEHTVILFDTLWKNGKDPATLLKELSNLVRDILMMKVAPDSAEALIYGGYDRNSLRSFASEMTEEELTAALDTLQAALGNMSLRSDPKMTAELTLVSLCRDLNGDSVRSLRGRISALEKAMQNGLLLRGGMPVTDSLPLRSTVSAETGMPAGGTVPASDSRFPYSAVPVPASDAAAPAAAPASVSAAAASAPQQSSPQSAFAAASVAPAVPAVSGYEDHVIPAVQNKPVDSIAQMDSGFAGTVNPSASSSVPDSVPDPELWQKICAYVKELLPVGIRPWLSEPGRITPRFQDGTLFVETEGGFFLAQLNRPEIVAKFEAAVSAVTGNGMQVRVREHQPDTPVFSGKGNLEELRKFPEVRFI